MAEENFQERTESASPRRRDKAREEGQVTKSAELNSAFIIALGFTALFLLGPFMAGQLADVMRHILGNATSFDVSASGVSEMFRENIFMYLLVLGPIFAALLIIGVGSNVAQVGFHISPKALQPKLEKLNIIAGCKRLFSTKSFVHILRDTIKLIIIGFVGYKVISGEFESFFLLPDMSVSQLAVTMGKLTLLISVKIGVAIFILAVLDYMYQKYEFEKSIRMSKQEVKEEYKETEGSPQMKSRIRQIQREMSRKRMMQDVVKADVVITNPTHFAVAIKYDSDRMNAPFVLAKGERLIALRIKQIALENDIPIIEDKQLARALYKLCEIGQMVPQTLYRAVAEVLAYVYKLKDKSPVLS
ncbi:MAG: flagellar biosynthesis protein FlhB [candidate division Zixibacteria bacterium]|nr:flagellar biosynthesis protein FlhB [candidate division Zixibacteria bacterium]